MRSHVLAPVHPGITSAELESSFSKSNSKVVIHFGASDVARRVGNLVTKAEPTVVVRAHSSVGEEGPKSVFLRLDIPQVGSVLNGTPRFDFSDANLQLRTPSAASDVALLLPTSGRTGDPKLVPLTHAAVLDACSAFASVYSLSPDDCHLHNMPLYHIGGLCPALMAPMLGGGAKICMTCRLDPADFLDVVIEYGVTFYTGAPAMLQSVLSHVKSARAPTTALRFVRSSSAPLPSSVEAELEAKLGVRTINSYAMTEAASIVTSQLLEPHGKVIGTLGVPVGNTEVCIADPGKTDIEKLRVGVMGEICVKATAFQGYLSGSGVRNDGWFRTGDVGCLDEHGNLTFHGTIKEVINVGGENVSPSEIEDAIVVPGVVTIAFPMPDVDLGQVPGVLLVPPLGHEDTTALAKEVYARCLNGLSTYKLPKKIYIVEDESIIPKTASNKVKRMEVHGALAENCVKAIDALSLSLDVYVSPSTELEEQVCQAFQEVLGSSDPVSVTADFFACGGTSLQVFRVIAKLQSLLDVDGLSPVLVHEGRTPRAVALSIGAEVLDAGFQHPLVRNIWSNAYRELPLCQKVYLRTVEISGNRGHNLCHPMVMETALDKHAAAVAIERLLSRHEVLRTSFCRAGDDIRVMIRDLNAMAWVSFAVAQSEDDLDNQVYDAINKEIDFVNGPLFHAHFIQVETNECRTVVVFQMHHLIMDGWSLPILVREFIDGYGQAHTHRELVQENNDAQYYDYAKWDNESHADGLLDRKLGYWKDTFSLLSPEPIVIPDHKMGENFQRQSGRRSKSIDQAVQDGLKAMAKELQVNESIITMTACSFAVNNLYKSDDIMFMTPMALRDNPATHPMIGYLVNSGLVYKKVSPWNRKKSQFVQDATEWRDAVMLSSVNTLPHGFLIKNFPNLRPNIQIGFQHWVSKDFYSYQGNLDSPGLQCKPYQMQIDRGFTNMELYFWVKPESVSLEYFAELFETSTIDKLLDDVISILSSVVLLG